MGTGNLPTWLENSPATLFEPKFLKWMPVLPEMLFSPEYPSLHWAWHTQYQAKTQLRRPVPCVLSERAMSPGSPRPFLPLALQWGDHVPQSVSCPSPPEKLTHCE